MRNNMTQGTFDACLPVTSQDSPFYRFLSLTMYSACAVTDVILSTLIVHVT